MAKLVAFSVALAVVPISSYFGSLWYIFNGAYMYFLPPSFRIPLLRVTWGITRAYGLPFSFIYDNRIPGNATFAAIVAVVAANLVLVLYITLSILEDQGDQKHSDSAKTNLESRKSR